MWEVAALVGSLLLGGYPVLSRCSKSSFAIVSHVNRGEHGRNGDKRTSQFWNIVFVFIWFFLYGFFLIFVLFGLPREVTGIGTRITFSHLSSVL